MEIVVEFRQRLQQARNDIAETLVSGQAKSHDQYNRFVGRAEGIVIAQQLLDDVIIELREEDDE